MSEPAKEKTLPNMLAGKCNVCNKNDAIGVACVPMVPMSVAYCKECLVANSHPMSVLIANTVCIGGLDYANEYWKKMVMDSLKHQDKTLEWFNAEVQKSIDETGEVEFSSEPIFMNPKFNPKWAKPHLYQHSSGYPDDQLICLCGKDRNDGIHT